MGRLRIYYQNVRGLRTKQDEIYSSLVDVEADIVALTETWLDYYHANDSFFPPNFNVFRADRNYSPTIQRGGGSAIAVRSDIKCVRRRNLELFPETVWIEVFRPGNKNLLIGNIYLSQCASSQDFDAYLESLSQRVNFLLTDVLFIGDFNSSGVNWDMREFSPVIGYYSKCRAVSLFNFVDLMNLEVKTHLTNKPAFLNNNLDLVLTNCVMSTADAEGLVSPDVYHCPFTMTVHDVDTVRVVNDRPIFRFGRGNYRALYEDVRCTGWSNILLSDNLNSAVVEFQEVILRAISKHVPQSPPKSNKYPSWFSSEVIVLLRLKRRAHTRYKETGLMEDYTKFSVLRKDVKKAIAHARRLYALRCESELRSRPANFWRYVARQRVNKEQTPAPIIDGQIISNLQLVTERFGKYFQSVFHEPPCVPFCEDLRNDVPVLEIPSISPSMVSRAIAQLNTSSSPGSDGIPIFVLKGLSDVISPVLSSLFNWSLSSSDFPSVWKRSIVVPIPKPGISELTNFRPISLLNSVSKIFEHIIYQSIHNHIFPFISPFQHGFMPGRSVSTNIASFLQDSASVIERRGQVDAIYFDFAKAFDKISHTVLLRKCRRMGFGLRMIAWLASYLAGRCFSVRFGGCLSKSTFHAPSGVPQGSKLGPILFLIFINDVADVINCNYQIFADDLKIYLPIKSRDDHLTLQANINSIANWAERNHLPLNLLKTKHVMFSRKTNPLMSDYKICSKLITTVTTIKDLGVVLDSKLYFVENINNIVSKARRNLGLMKWMCRMFDNVDTCVLLYKALVRSHLEFCTVVWNSNRAYTSDLIESVQNRFLNWIKYKFHYIYGDTSRQALSVQLNTPSLSSRRTYFDLLFFHRNLHNNLPNNTQVNMHNPSYSLRNHRLFCTPLGATISPVERCTSVAVIHQDKLDFWQDEMSFKKNLHDVIRA